MTAPSILQTPRLRPVPPERRHFEAEAEVFARPPSRPKGGPEPRERVGAERERTLDLCRPDRAEAFRRSGPEGSASGRTRQEASA